MTLKIIPPFSEDKANVEFQSMISRSGATYVEVNKLYDLWAPLSRGGVVVATLPLVELMVLQRHMDTLLVEVPSVVTGVPGAFYSGEWNMFAGHLISEPYSSLEQQLSKSGFLSHTTDQAVERGSQALPPVEPPAKATRLSLRASTTDDDEDDDQLFVEEHL